MMKLKHIALAAITLFVVGCSSKKDTNALPEVYLVTDVATFGNDQAIIKKELSRWFIPFKEQELCPNIRVYPQVRVVLIDTDPLVSERIISINPKTLVALNQNFVQKVFGAKPKFEKLIDLANQSINAANIPSSLLSAAGITTTAKDIGRIQSDFTLFMSKHDTKDSKYSVLNNDPNKFREAIATSLCKTYKDNKVAKDVMNVVLIDYGKSTEVPKPPMPNDTKPVIPPVVHGVGVNPTIITPPRPSDHHHSYPLRRETEGKRTDPNKMAPINQ